MSTGVALAPAVTVTGRACRALLFNRWRELGCHARSFNGSGVSDSDVADLVPRDQAATTRRRWQALIGLASITGLAVAAVSTVDDAREQALPGAMPIAVALLLQFIAMTLAARGWIALFPDESDRKALARGLYTSQLTKYLPAGGVLQAASQVALSSQDVGVGAAALRLPVFSLCSVVAAATVGSALAIVGDLSSWARIAAGLCLGLLILLDRRVLGIALNLARRAMHRLPPPEQLPDQRAIVRCYCNVLTNQVAYACAFVVLLDDLADIDRAAAAAAFCAGWAIGYLALPLPSGVLVREGVLIATLPGLATGTLLAASVAHRLTGFLAETVLAGRAHIATVGRRRTR